MTELKCRLGEIARALGLDGWAFEYQQDESFKRIAQAVQLSRDQGRLLKKLEAEAQRAKAERDGAEASLRSIEEQLALLRAEAPRG